MFLIDPPGQKSWSRPCNQPLLDYIFPFPTINYKKMMKWTQERQFFGSNFPIKNPLISSFFFSFFFYSDVRHMSNKRFKATKQSTSKNQIISLALKFETFQQPTSLKQTHWITSNFCHLMPKLLKSLLRAIPIPEKTFLNEVLNTTQVLRQMDVYEHNNFLNQRSFKHDKSLEIVEHNMILIQRGL